MKTTKKINTRWGVAVLNSKGELGALIPFTTRKEARDGRAMLLADGITAKRPFKIYVEV